MEPILVLLEIRYDARSHERKILENLLSIEKIELEFVLEITVLN